MIDVLRSLVKARRLTIHDFVIMPDHVHVLMTLPGDLTVEKAMQLIKGSFSFRANKELAFGGEIWQRGFSDASIRDAKSFQDRKRYIDMNPVKAGLVGCPEDYPFGTACLKRSKNAEAKARSEGELYSTTKVVP